MHVGVLGIQGGFSKHKEILESLGVIVSIIRTPNELNEVDALVIPGGESTTFLHLFNKLDLNQSIKKFSKRAPIMGTCAGLIVLSKSVDSLPFATLNLIDIEVSRNAYGRQKNSFSEQIVIELNSKPTDFEAVFIRAPKISKIGPDCRILARHNDDAIMVRNDSVLVCTFHPELTNNNLIHKYFLDNFV